MTTPPNDHGTTPGTESGTDPRAALTAVRAEIGKAVVGQDAAVAGLIVALLCRGHVLLEGVPGVAKTLLVRALAAALDVRKARIQFTPVALNAIDHAPHTFGETRNDGALNLRDDQKAPP